MLEHNKNNNNFYCIKKLSRVYYFCYCSFSSSENLLKLPAFCNRNIYRKTLSYFYYYYLLLLFIILFHAGYFYFLNAKLLQDLRTFGAEMDP